MEYIEKALKDSGANKLKDGYYYLNGWRVRFNTRGVYWHNRLSEDLKIALDGLEYGEKGGKPYSALKTLTRSTIQEFVNRLAQNKTRAVLRKEAREAAARKRAEKRRLPKRIWCRGCPFATGSGKKCDSMKWSDMRSIFYCADTRFYEWYWCVNARRVGTHKRRPWEGKFVCRITEEPCPYQVPMITKGAHALGTNALGEHYTACENFKRGERNEDN